MAYTEFKIVDGSPVVYLSGRIDSASAPVVESEMEAFLPDGPELVLDLEKLEYISSAGLRVVLRLRKQYPDISIINASQEVFEIFEMTGFSEMMPIERAMRHLSVDGCTVIGKGAKGTVYRYNPDTIVKVYNDASSLPGIRRERELARKAFVLGVPTAIPYDVVLVGDCYGSVFELLDAEPLTAYVTREPEKIDEYAGIFAELLRTIHTTEVSPSDMPDGRLLIREWIKTAAPALYEGDAARVSGLVDALPEIHTMLHGDFHTNNIMMQNGEALLIDMDTLSWGAPVFELANVYIAYKGFRIISDKMVEDFLNMPADLAGKFFDTFLPMYLGTDNPEKVKETEQKAELMALMRLARHVLRRDPDSDETKRIVSCCAERVHTLLDSVNSLEF